MRRTPCPRGSVCSNREHLRIGPARASEGQPARSCSGPACRGTPRRVAGAMAAEAVARASGCRRCTLGSGTTCMPTPRPPRDTTRRTRQSLYLPQLDHAMTRIREGEAGPRWRQSMQLAGVSSRRRRQIRPDYPRSRREMWRPPALAGGSQMAESEQLQAETRQQAARPAVRQAASEPSAARGSVAAEDSLHLPPPAPQGAAAPAARGSQSSPLASLPSLAAAAPPRPAVGLEAVARGRAPTGVVERDKVPKGEAPRLWSLRGSPRSPGKRMWKIVLLRRIRSQSNGTTHSGDCGGRDRTRPHTAQHGSLHGSYDHGRKARPQASLRPTEETTAPADRPPPSPPPLPLPRSLQKKDCRL
eukprot:scaffold306066_cov24-Tisochrysis_lutea.AAC.3